MNLHKPGQVSCHVLYKIAIWSDHHFSYKSKTQDLGIWVHKLFVEWVADHVVRDVMSDFR